MTHRQVCGICGMCGCKLDAGTRSGHVARYSFCTHPLMIIPCSLPCNLRSMCLCMLRPDPKPRRQVRACITTQTQLLNCMATWLKSCKTWSAKTAISPSPAVCTALQLQGGQVWFYKYSYTQAGRAMIRRSAWSITRVSRHLYMLCSHVHTSQLRTNIEAQAFCHSAHNGLVYMRKLSEIAQGSGVWWTTYSLSAEVMFFLHIWESVKSPST